jgi:hypothetical protein
VRLAGRGVVEDEAVEAVEGGPQHLGVAAPAGGHRRKEQSLPEEPLADGSEVGEQPEVLGHARPECVGQPHAAPAGGVEQAGHPRRARDEPRSAGAELERVGRHVLHPAEEHVEGLEAAEGTQPDPAVAHGQVGALRQVVAEVGGQVAVLGVAAMGGPGGEHGRAGALPAGRRQGTQGLSEVGEPRAQPLHAQLAVDVGEQP